MAPPPDPRSIAEKFQDTWLQEMRAAADSIKENVTAQNTTTRLQANAEEDGYANVQLDTQLPNGQTQVTPNEAAPPPSPDGGDKPNMELVATVWYETMCAAIKSAADKSLPPRKKKSLAERKVSARTKRLYKLKKSMQRRANVSRKDLNNLQKRIQESCLNDFKKWVLDVVVDMEKADAVGNTKKVFNLVKMLSNKPRTPPTNLTSDDAGNLLRSPEDIAKIWEKFLSEKFAATPEEQLRPDMPPLPKTHV